VGDDNGFVCIGDAAFIPFRQFDGGLDGLGDDVIGRCRTEDQAFEQRVTGRPVYAASPTA
jgi:hypothetical protein